MLQPNFNPDEIDFELFARLVAIILEISQLNQDEQILEDEKHDAEEDQQWEERNDNVEYD